MKNKIILLPVLAFSAIFMISCDKNELPPVQTEPNVSYIINYGSYTGDKSTITAFNKETSTVTNNFYAGVNGVALTSNIQHAISHGGKIYFLGNSVDQLFWVDGETFEQTENAITDGIIKPRYGVGTGNYLYVSCWGGNIWEDQSVSYIAKVNLDTKVVEKTLALPGGPEGMAIVNNKLYAALNYADSVAVIDLGSEEVSYIETPAVTSFFVKDDNDNLYVSLVSTYSDYSETTGLGYINTSSDELTGVYQLNGVSTSYVNLLSPNDDFTKLYVMTSVYDDNWNLSGAVAVFDVASKSFETENLVENISGLNGLAFYNDKVLIFETETVTGNGKAAVYNTDGTKAGEFETGISPFMLLTAN